MGFSYFVGAAFIIYGAYLKLMHFGDKNNLMLWGSSILFVFIIVAIIELFNFKKINPFERGFWFAGLLFLPVIVGFFYLTKARRKIITNNSQ